MYTLITDKETNAIISYGNPEDLSYQEETGYPMFVSQNVAFPTSYVNVIEVSEIPEEVLSKGYGNYCYTEEDQFYWNPKIEVPEEGNIYNMPNALYDQILDDYREKLLKEVQSYGYNA